MARKDRGSCKVEFFTLLPTIRKLYDEGNVVGKILYDRLVSEGKITMSYRRFAEYFSSEIVNRHTDGNNVSFSTSTTNVSDEKISENQDGPIIFTIGGKGDKKPFNPHASGVHPKKIL